MAGAMKHPGDRLSARNPVPIHTTGAMHFLKLVRSLQSGMEKETWAADKTASYVLRLMTKDGRTVFEIALDDVQVDEKAAVELAAQLLRRAR